MAMNTEQEVVSLDTAMKRLKILDAGEDEENLQLMLTEAQGIVLRYILSTATEERTLEIEAWDEETVPESVAAAVLLQFGELYRFRGDDAQADVLKVEPGFLSPRVRSLLTSYRDPALA